MRYNSSGILRREIAIRRDVCLQATVADFVPPDEIFIVIEDTEENLNQYSALMADLNESNWDDDGSRGTL